MKWCFDTSALIEPWVRHYPPDVFQTVWDQLAKLADAGVIGAPVDVRIELERQSDPLTEWAKTLKSFFVEADRQVMECYTDIINKHPKFMKVNSTKSGADPFVVAHAEILHIPVVTYETHAKKDAAPKIPNVCDLRKVTCVSLVEVLRQEGFKV